MKRGFAGSQTGSKAHLWRFLKRKPKPILSGKRLRQAKALAAANRRAYILLAIAAAVVFGLFEIVLSVPPSISPTQLAATVKAQMVHRRARAFPTGSTAAAPQPANPGDGQGVKPPVTDLSAQATSHYLPVSFEQLSAFPFLITDRLVDRKEDSGFAAYQTMGQIPAEVRALSEKTVKLSGFMLPMKFEGKLTTDFLLLRNQSLCCYGVPPKITEWVNVRMAGKGVRAVLDQSVMVCGTFHVGEVRENGDLVGIYRLDGESLERLGK